MHLHDAFTHSILTTAPKVGTPLVPVLQKREIGSSERERARESGLEPSAVIPEAELLSLYTLPSDSKAQRGCGLRLGHTAR